MSQSPVKQFSLNLHQSQNLTLGALQKLIPVYRLKTFIQVKATILIENEVYKSHFSVLEYFRNSPRV